MKNILRDAVAIMYKNISLEYELHNCNISKSEDQEILLSNVRDDFGRRKRSYKPDELQIFKNAKQKRTHFSESIKNSENFSNSLNNTFEI